MHAVGGDVIDGVADRPAREERLVEVADVVDLDVGLARAARVAERADVVREAEVAR